MPFTKHGHPYGTVEASDMDAGTRVVVARCGGPGICRECSAEAVVMVGFTLPQVVMVGFDPRRSQWRVGRKLGRTIYAQTPEGGDFLVGMVESRELAEHIVALQNHEAC